MTQRTMHLQVSVMTFSSCSCNRFYSCLMRFVFMFIVFCLLGPVWKFDYLIALLLLGLFRVLSVVVFLALLLDVIGGLCFVIVTLPGHLDPVV